MKLRFLSFLLATCGVLGTYAHELQLSEFKDTMEPDAVRFRVDDTAGVACALVKIGLIAQDPVFSGAVKSEYKDGEYWVYLPEGIDNVLIKTANFVPFTCNFGKPLQSLFTYRATILPKDGSTTAGEKNNTTPLAADAITIEIPGSTQKFNMVLVKPGMFEMGATGEQGSKEDDERPVHWVKITKAYYIGETEVTQGVWEAVMGNNPSSFIDANKPVEGISWSDAQRFINRLNGLTGKQFAMPTEAQWEYAARGAHMSQLARYSGSHNPDEVGWHKGNSANRLHNVKELKPNEIGAYDMSGNVWEFCQDYKQKYPKETVTDPMETKMSENRVRRGGSWKSATTDELRNSYRRRVPENEVVTDTGLRLILPKE